MFVCFYVPITIDAAGFSRNFLSLYQTTRRIVMEYRNNYVHRHEHLNPILFVTLVSYT